MTPLVGSELQRERVASLLRRAEEERLASRVVAHRREAAGASTPGEVRTARSQGLRWRVGRALVLAGTRIAGGIEQS